MPPLEIELFGDIVCPWCYVGTHRLERVIAALPEPQRVAVVHRPFLLRPATPAQGLDIHAELRKRFGGDLEPVFARLVAEAQASDLELDPRRQPFAFPTLPAHTLLRHALAKGTQRALALALFHAHFVLAKNISDPETLAELASAHGFTRDEALALLASPAEQIITRSETEEASAAGIRGVPLFVIGGRALPGAQPEPVLREAIDAALAHAS